MVRRRPLVLVLAAVVVAGLGAAVWWFEPHALVVDDRVEEAAPVVAAIGGDAPSSGTEILSAGRVAGVAGHELEGSAALLEAGSDRYLRFEDLSGDNGPDLVVYLSAAPADGDPDALDDDVIELGTLKGNVGSSNYLLPADVDLDRYSTAVIWCRRFGVGFAAARLVAPPAA